MKAATIWKKKMEFAERDGKSENYEKVVGKMEKAKMRWSYMECDQVFLRGGAGCQGESKRMYICEYCSPTQMKRSDME